ncbi:hypothetical protein, partial [Acinetobacter baumannii]|uniref:hypothetical protein n=1 Tax=Acinetobacter baumannii TaxID=470 RepID=UPI001C07849F
MRLPENAKNFVFCGTSASQFLDSCADFLLFEVYLKTQVLYFVHPCTCDQQQADFLKVNWTMKTN